MYPNSIYFGIGGSTLGPRYILFGYMDPWGKAMSEKTPCFMYIIPVLRSSFMYCMFFAVVGNGAGGFVGDCCWISCDKTRWTGECRVVAL